MSAPALVLRLTSGTRARAGFAAVAALLGAAAFAATAFAAPLPQVRTGVIGTAPSGAEVRLATAVPSTIVLYDNTGSGSTSYYDGQGGHEAIDDVHMVSGGSPNAVAFEYFDPVLAGTLSATVTIYGNSSGFDLAATPLIGTYTVTGLSGGRHLVSVPLPNAPVVDKDIWVGVQFTSATAGLIINSVPSVGSSHDTYLEDGSFFNFGGSPKANFALRVVEIPSFGLNVNVSGSGTVTRDLNQASYLSGTVVHLTANPDPHWHLANWSGDASGTDNPLAVVVDANKTITATFAIDTHTLTYTAGVGGSISGTAVQTVGYGADGTQVTAIAGTGYHFTGWSDGVTTAARTELNVTADVSVTATFALNSYTLSYAAGPHGSISGTATQTVSHGSNGTQVTAVPDAGYHFVGWSDGVATASRTETNVQASLSVTATFAINTYTLSYAAGPNGSINGTASQTVNHGADGTQVTAVADPGYHFVGWSDGVATAARTETNVQASLSVTATFAINMYTLTYTAGLHGTLTGTTSQLVAHGSNGTQVTAVADPGYHFVSWSDGVLTASRTDLNVTASISVTASFATTTYTLQYTAGPGGTISGTATQVVASGANGTPVTAVPNTGYHFVNWSDGVLTAARTETTVTADVSVTAAFAINVYSLNYAAGPNGTLTGATSQSVPHGSNGTQVTAVPDPTFHFVSWSDGVLTAARTDLHVTGDINVTASFALVTYTLTYTAGPGGTISGTKVQSVGSGGNGTQVTAVPNTGYHFVNWSDGKLTAARTDLNVTGDLSVTATFAINTYTLTYAAGAGGTLTGATTQTVNFGGSGTQVTAVPNPGYHFVAWSDGVATAARTDQHVASDLSVTAGFAINTYTLAVTVVGSGTVTKNPDLTTYAYGTPVTLTATGATGSHFVSWGGDASGTSTTTTVTMTASRSVTATFASDNLLIASVGFETGLQGWEAYGSATLTRTSPGHGGSTYAAKLTGPSFLKEFGISGTIRMMSPADSSRLAPSVSLRGIRYRVSAWVRSDAGRGTARLRVVSSDGVGIPQPVYSPGKTLSSVWQQVAVEIAANRVVTSFDIRVLDQPLATRETFLVDDITVEVLPPAAELCGNGGFEQDTHGWGPYGSAVLSRVTGGHSGSFALQLKAGTARSTFGCDDTPNWVTTVSGAGATYHFTAWVRSASNRGSVKLRVGEFVGGAQQGSTASSSSVTLSTSWQQVTLDYVVRTAGSTLSMAVTDSPSSSFNTETFLVDDVSITQSGAPAVVAGLAPVAALAPGAGDEGSVTLEYARPVVFPNPARGAATLALSLAKAGPLRIELFDVSGRVVRVLADEALAAAGTHRFALSTGSKLGAGMYFYQVQLGGMVQRGRFVVLE